MEKIIKTLSYLSLILLIVIVSILFIYPFYRADFILDKKIFYAILGTFELGILSMIFGGILAAATAVYNIFYCRRGKFFISAIIRCSAGIPSIILGLFGYHFFVINMGFGRSMLASSLTLGIMIFPYIEIELEKCFNEVSRNLIDMSKSLGVSREYMLIKLIFPVCRVEILNILTLASGFAMGATAPIILTGAIMYGKTGDIMKPFMALPYHIYILTSEGISVEGAFTASSILLVMVLLLNLGAKIVFNFIFNFFYNK